MDHVHVYSQEKARHFGFSINCAIMHVPPGIGWHGKWRSRCAELRGHVQKVKLGAFAFYRDVSYFPHGLSGLAAVLAPPEIEVHCFSDANSPHLRPLCDFRTMARLGNKCVMYVRRHRRASVSCCSDRYGYSELIARMDFKESKIYKFIHVSSICKLRQLRRSWRPSGPEANELKEVPRLKLFPEWECDTIG